MSEQLRLCANCLGGGAHNVEVGGEKGTQRDPWRSLVQLCQTCDDLLNAGDFAMIHERFKTERAVHRG